MKTLSKEVIEAAVKKNGYRWFDDKINVVGIRTADKTTNKFNDFIVIAYKRNVTWEFIGFEATTDPGLYWLNKPGNVKGTAILCEGQYVDCWALGKHSGYDAFVQVREVNVYRDNNRDDYLNFDKNTVDRGLFGINIHRAHAEFLQIVVDKYSAGCQVFRRASSLNKLIEIFKASGQKYLSYTLLNENQL